MGFGRRVKAGLRAVMAPTLFLGVAGYFAWSATQGERGLQSYALRQTQLAGVQAELHRLEAERDTLERRVAGLRQSRLDPDTLDQQARAMLNLADPGDVVMMYSTDRKLF